MNDYRDRIRKELAELLFEHIKKELKEPTSMADHERLPKMIRLLLRTLFLS